MSTQTSPDTEGSTPTLNKPPLLAYVTFKNFIDGLKKNGVIPTRIDKTLMSGQSGSTQSYLLSALRFFGLIAANGTPTGDLGALVNSEGDERKAILRRIFERAYAPVIGDLDLERATVGMLNEKFANQGFTGDSIRKCHAFFAMAAEDAGVPIAALLKVGPSRGGGVKRGRRKANGKPTDEGSDEFAHANEHGNDHEMTQVATLLLDKDGKRTVKIKAPATITNAELDRIQKWLSFQLIVADGE